jgi:hypothetical protein
MRCPSSETLAAQQALEALMRMNIILMSPGSRRRRVAGRVVRPGPPVTGSGLHAGARAQMRDDAHAGRVTDAASGLLGLHLALGALDCRSMRRHSIAKDVGVRTFCPPLSHRLLVASEWLVLGPRAIVVIACFMSATYEWQGRPIAVVLFLFLGWSVARALMLSISLVDGTSVRLRNPLRTYEIILDGDARMELCTLGTIFPTAVGIKTTSASGVVKMVAPAILKPLDRERLISELREAAKRTGAHVDLPGRWPGTW